jgi:hypothetical protein
MRVGLRGRSGDELRHGLRNAVPISPSAQAVHLPAAGRDERRRNSRALAKRRIRGLHRRGGLARLGRRARS